MCWLDQLVDTPVSILYHPSLAATVPNVLSRLPTADLSTILVEPSFLTRLSTA